MIFNMNVDGAARIAHATEGRDNPGWYNRFDIHHRCYPL
jgi:hypothetical protein